MLSDQFISQPFFHKPLINFFKLLYFPQPCFTPFSQLPQQYQPLLQCIIPKPQRLPLLQLPWQRLPFGQIYSPSPCFSLFFHCPRQISPLSLCITAQPSRLLSTKFPQKMQPFCMRTPFPCFLLFKNSPLYLLQPWYIASPLPLGRLFFHCPSYVQPEASIYLPQPSATLLRMSPSQQLPSFLISLPLPSHTPLIKSPSRQSPFSNQSDPTPFGLLLYSSPQQVAFNLSINTFLGSFPFITLLFAEREGSSLILNLTFSDNLECCFLRLLARMLSLELVARLIQVESDSSFRKGDQSSQLEFELAFISWIGGA